MPVLFIALGVGARIWSALQWQTNFDSDEAVFGLMAKHLLEGAYSPTVYGTDHLGSIESVLSAPLLHIFGDSVIVLRLAPISLFGLFLALHYLVVQRHWNRRVGLLSLLILGLPGFHMLAWTYQPIGAYCALLALGTLFVFLVGLRGDESSYGTGRLVAIGIVAGLGVWANQMFVVYLFSVLTIRFIGSEGWQRARERLSNVWDRESDVPFNEIVPALSFILVGIGILAFFSGGCNPPWHYEKVQLVMRLALGIVGLIAVSGAIAMASRSRRSIVNLFLGVAGGAIGFAPQWLPWVLAGSAPAFTVRPSCPTGVFGRMELLLKELLPAVVGIPPWSAVQMLPFSWWPLWALAGLVAVLVILVFVGKSFETWWNYFTLRAVRADREGTLFWLILFALPVALSILASNTADLGSARHLLVSWQAFSVLFAVVVVEGGRRYGSAIVAAGFTWAFAVGAYNMAMTPSSWNVKFTRYHTAHVVELVDYLNSRGISHAMADYWGAYTLTYLSDESLIVGPYNGLNRYPQYLSRSMQARLKAVLVPRARAPQPGTDFDLLEAYMDREHVESGEGSARPRILEHLAEARILQRVVIGPWDVWIFEAE